MRDNRRAARDFCFLSTPSDDRLSHFERLTLVGGEELEKAVKWASERFQALPATIAPEKLDPEALRAAHQYYRKFVRGKRLRDFFVAPKGIPEVCERLIHGLPGGEVRDLEFQSSFRSRHPLFKHEWADPERNRVFARYWRHETGARATVIALHGWTMGDQRINSLAFLPGVLYQLGYDVVLVELPYHGRRRVLSGPRVPFPSMDVVLTNEAVARTISEVRELRSYLMARGAPRIGCAGMSLGGYLAALWGNLDELEFVIPIVPVCSFGDYAWRRLAETSHARDELQALGITRSMLTELFAVHSPLSFRPRTPPERVFIVAGTEDSIVPREEPERLWRHWKRPRIAWLRGGHNVPFMNASAFEKMARFLRFL